MPPTLRAVRRPSAPVAFRAEMPCALDVRRAAPRSAPRLALASLSAPVPASPPQSPGRRPSYVTRRHVREAAGALLQALAIDGIPPLDARARVLADGTLLVIASWPGTNIAQDAATRAAARVAAVLGTDAATVRVGTWGLLAGRVSMTVFHDEEAVALEEHRSAFARLLGAAGGTPPGAAVTAGAPRDR